MRNDEDDFTTKSERREKRKGNTRKMKVSGKGNLLLWQIIKDKSNKLKRKENDTRQSS